MLHASVGNIAAPTQIDVGQGREIFCERLQANVGDLIAPSNIEIGQGRQGAKILDASVSDQTAI